METLPRRNVIQFIGYSMLAGATLPLVGGCERFTGSSGSDLVELDALKEKFKQTPPAIDYTDGQKTFINFLMNEEEIGNILRPELANRIPVLSKDEYIAVKWMVGTVLFNGTEGDQNNIETMAIAYSKQNRHFIVTAPSFGGLGIVELEKLPSVAENLKAGGRIEMTNLLQFVILCIQWQTE